VDARNEEGATPGDAAPDCLQLASVNRSLELVNFDAGYTAGAAFARNRKGIGA
jgi:hypothetical protein